MNNLNENEFVNIIPDDVENLGHFQMSIFPGDIEIDQGLIDLPFITLSCDHNMDDGACGFDPESMQENEANTTDSMDFDECLRLLSSIDTSAKNEVVAEQDGMISPDSLTLSINVTPEQSDNDLEQIETPESGSTPTDEIPFESERPFLNALLKDVNDSKCETNLFLKWLFGSIRWAKKRKAAGLKAPPSEQLRRDGTPLRQRKIFECACCSKWSTGKANLGRHLQTHAPEGRSNLCPFCLKVYSRLDVLQNHTRKIHGETYINPWESLKWWRWLGVYRTLQRGNTFAAWLIRSRTQSQLWLW